MMGDQHRPRIRLRFTALYAVTLLVVLLGAAGTLRYALRVTLQREFDKSVLASAGLVQQFFRAEVEEYVTVEATLAHIAGELVFEERAIRIRKPDGALFKIVGAPVRRARRPLSGPVRTVRFLVLCAAVAGWWLTGRTLRPVGRMAEAASRIAPASGARLPIDDPTDELGRLGLRFNALLDRLDGALAQQREFLADAAHELRTPIARLRARVEVAMLEPATASASDRNVLPGIDQELRAVSQQVDELLQLARADAAGEDAPMRAESLFLDDVVMDELPRWQPEAQRRQMTLDYSALEESPVVGDASLLPRMVSILVDNAIRYGHEGGIVRVRVRPEDGAVLLDVEDDGIGIPEHERPRIFDRFFRGDAARRQRPDGSGLGLAIAAWIVRQHHGTIAVAGGEQRGTRVQVRLPLATS